MEDDELFECRIAAVRPTLPRRADPLDGARLAQLEAILTEQDPDAETTSGVETTRAADRRRLIDPDPVPRARPSRPARAARGSRTGGASGPSRPSSTRGRTAFGLAASLLVLVVIGGLAGGLWQVHGEPAEARAVTPPPLETTRVAGGPERALADLAESLADAPADGALLESSAARSAEASAADAVGGLEPGREPGAEAVQFQFWAIEITPDDAETPSRYMQPARQTIVSHADGSVSLEQVAVGPVTAEGIPAEDPDAPRSGDVIWQQDFAPGEFMYLFKEPYDAQDWSSYLREGEGIEGDASTLEYFRAVNDLLSERKLAPGKQSSLVGFLASLPDVVLEGATVDRLGREGVSFSVTEGDTKNVLVISPELGVIAFESVYLGTDDTYVDAPAVMNYTSWY